MKFAIYFLFFFACSHVLGSSYDFCHLALTEIGNYNSHQISELFAYRSANNDTWLKQGTIDGSNYSLYPESLTTYTIRWQVKTKSQDISLEDGSMVCELPKRWSLAIKNSLLISYPSVVKSAHEKTAYYSIVAFAGLYLAKSHYELNPDVVRLMWHLDQSVISRAAIDLFLSQHPFIQASEIEIHENIFDTSNQTMLVAINFSNHQSISEGEQRWMITDAQGLRAIKDKKYATENSPHHGWLPWLDKSNPEFHAKSAVEAYQTTIVAPLGQSRIFDRQNQQYDAENVSVIQHMQRIYDLVSPPVNNHISGSAPLFAHLVLKCPTGFELFTMELLETGAIIQKSQTSISNTNTIGLPSSHSLGF